MKTLFIEAKYDKPIKIDNRIAEKLPSKIGLVSSIQFLDSLPLIKKSLLNKNKIKKIIIGGQILGCNAKNAEKISNKVDAFLYIGDGKFHPLGVAIKTKKTVFTFNPLNNSTENNFSEVNLTSLNKPFKKIEKQDIEDYEKRKKAAFVKFLHAENVGVLVSTKYGQYYPINKLNSIMKKLNKKYKNKKFYTFIADTIDYNQLENFPFIQAWINTACPRIEEDIPILNINDLK